jgi:hypothetical protein
MKALKEKLQKRGSQMVSLLSGTKLTDAMSGFRGLQPEAALRMNVFSSFVYTLQTTIQAGTNQMTMAHVPVDANTPTRRNR